MTLRLTGIYRWNPLALATGVAFIWCFGAPLAGLIRAWFTVSDASHGLLIVPVSIWLAWRTGLVSDRGLPVMGGLVLGIAIGALTIGRIGGVDTLPRLAMMLGLVGLTLWVGGWRQVLAWWLPFVLVGLTIPIPESLIMAVTIPLQGLAAKMGAAMLEWRNMPVHLAGNVIQLPGHTLFVSEACSGLRSLTALLSLALLTGALFLDRITSRVLLFALAIGLAIVVNGLRVFLTGFLVYFVDPRLGEGFMHLSEGYLLFLFSLMMLAGITWVLRAGERRLAFSGAAE